MHGSMIIATQDQLFSTDNLSWIDFEVFGGALDLKATGTFRYVAETSTRAIVLAYAIGNAPAQTWHADGAILDWDQAPNDLRNAFEHGAAWNASFDIGHSNTSTSGAWSSTYPMCAAPPRS